MNVLFCEFESRSWNSLDELKSFSSFGSGVLIEIIAGWKADWWVCILIAISGQLSVIKIYRMHLNVIPFIRWGFNWKVFNSGNSHSEMGGMGLKWIGGPRFARAFGLSCISRPYDRWLAMWWLRCSLTLISIYLKH